MTESSGLESKPASSWFSNFALSANLTNQISNLSSTIAEASSKVGTAANTLQKTMYDRLYTSNGNEQQTSETPKSTKDFTSIINDLSSTVLKGAQQLRSVVEEKTIIGNFTKEQDKFLTDKRMKQRLAETGILPWVGYDQEEEMKKQILSLSQEKRNFLRDPPPGANYNFNMTASYPVALAILNVDENLKQMRFELVPKQVNEESFWRNYFYRVSLIKQATQLSTLANENANSQANDEKSRNTSTQLERRTSELNEKSSDLNQEFVSEDYDNSALTMDDIRREIEQLTVAKNSNKTKRSSPDLDESEWDKGLGDELENVSAEELEAEINQLLAGTK